MHLPINWIKDENGQVTGYQKYSEADIIAAKEAKLLAMYEELKALKGE